MWFLSEIKTIAKIVRWISNINIIICKIKIKSLENNWPLLEFLMRLSYVVIHGRQIRAISTKLKEAENRKSHDTCTYMNRHYSFTHEYTLEKHNYQLNSTLYVDAFHLKLRYR